MSRGLLAVVGLGAAGFTGLAIWLVASGPPEEKRAPNAEAAGRPAARAPGPERAGSPPAPALPAAGAVPSGPAPVPLREGAVARTAAGPQEPPDTGIAAPEPAVDGAPPPPDPETPRLDVLRVDAEGRTVLAGRAPAGRSVDILLDGTPVATAEADGTGQFVALLDIPLSGAAQALVLRVRRSGPAPAQPLTDGGSASLSSPAAPAAVARGPAPEAAPGVSAERGAVPVVGGHGAAGPARSAARPAADARGSVVVGDAPDGDAGASRSSAAWPLADHGAAAPARDSVPDDTGTAPAQPGAPVPGPHAGEGAAASGGGAPAEATMPGRAAEAQARGMAGAGGAESMSPPGGATHAKPQARLGMGVAPLRAGAGGGPAGPVGGPDGGAGPEALTSAAPMRLPRAVAAAGGPVGGADTSGPRDGAGEDTGPRRPVTGSGPVRLPGASAGMSPRGPANGTVGPPPVPPSGSPAPAVPDPRGALSGGDGVAAPSVPARAVPSTGRAGAPETLAPEAGRRLPARHVPAVADLAEDRTALAARPLPSDGGAGTGAAGPRLPGGSPLAAGVARSPAERRAAPATPGAGRLPAGPQSGAPSPDAEETAVEGPASAAPTGATGNAERSAESVVVARADGAVEPTAGGADAAAPDPRYALSAPVLILPAGEDAADPVLVRPGGGAPDLVQPARLQPGQEISLDSISHAPGGEVVLQGRGRPGETVRLYVNALYHAAVPVGAGGAWRQVLPAGLARGARLLRLDAVAASGRVTGRLEAPFRYEAGAPDRRLETREVVIARGDHLWRIAERHYGEGLRYSVIYEANSDLIRDPDLIYPGQILTVPDLVDID